MPKFTLRWGILATGGIAETFSRDLLLNPETRHVNDIEHTVVAAGSSSGADRAAKFLKTIGAPESANPYGTYQELVEDKNVDIIYVASPHSHHYQNAMLALQEGKNVLCEKAFTVNAKQLEKLIETARAKNLFLAEAVWTRAFPLSTYVRDAITSGKIGTVHRAQADNSLAFGSHGEELFDASHRMVNPDLAGGALLDLGIYSLTWIFQTLYHTQPESERKPPQTMGSIRKYQNGVDEMTTVMLSFPRSDAKGGDMHGIATTGMTTSSDIDGKGTTGPSIRIFGEKGEIQVWPPAFRPTKTRIVLNDGTVEAKDWPQPGPGKGSGWFNGFGSDKNPEGEGHGMFWEADECAFAIRDGRKEARYESLQESLVIMQVMDKVRQDNGLVYPDKIETCDFPVQL